jgi:hypothetical protein
VRVNSALRPVIFSPLPRRYIPRNGWQDSPDIDYISGYLLNNMINQVKHEWVGTEQNSQDAVSADLNEIHQLSTLRLTGEFSGKNSEDCAVPSIGTYPV